MSCHPGGLIDLRMRYNAARGGRVVARPRERIRPSMLIMRLFD